MKAGDKVKLIDIKGIENYQCIITKKIKKNGIYKIRKVKPSGGVLFEEIVLGYNIEGKEQGIIQKRLKLIK